MLCRVSVVVALSTGFAAAPVYGIGRSPQGASGTPRDGTGGDAPRAAREGKGRADGRGGQKLPAKEPPRGGEALTASTRRCPRAVPSGASVGHGGRWPGAGPASRRRPSATTRTWSSRAAPGYAAGRVGRARGCYLRLRKTDQAAKSAGAGDGARSRCSTRRDARLGDGDASGPTRTADPLTACSRESTLDPASLLESRSPPRQDARRHDAPPLPSWPSCSARSRLPPTRRRRGVTSIRVPPTSASQASRCPKG